MRENEWIRHFNVYKWHDTHPPYHPPKIAVETLPTPPTQFATDRKSFAGIAGLHDHGWSKYRVLETS